MPRSGAKAATRGREAWDVSEREALVGTGDVAPRPVALEESDLPPSDMTNLDGER